MNDINKLGKMTEIIGKFLFGLLVAIIIVVAFAMQLTKYQNNGLSEKIAVMIGTLLCMVILIFILRLIFKPIYNLNSEIQLIKEGKLDPQSFKTKWLISLICSAIVSILPILPSFGLSIIIMLPQFLLLYKSNKSLNQQSNLSYFKDASNQAGRFIHNKSSFRVNFKNMTKQEYLVLILIVGIVIGLFLGYITGENQYFNAIGNRINVSNVNDNSVKVFKFNYLLFFCGFIISSGLSYLLISIKSKKQ
ncbi:hypothetical protein GCM10023210_18930 [Chryseobacterium ginsengisoli]|uniref:Permease n=1 Tax=Chryseobacterium ginsengisoli TaxID=363853 RepID=A0ABP9M9H2_9FLAO